MWTSRWATQPADLLPYTLEEDGSGIRPPEKWEVYEQILQVPYYLVFSRYTDRLRFFQLIGGQYQEQPLDAENPRAWLPDLNIGLGVWQGEFAGVSRAWLRWYDAAGNWLLTDTEQAEQQAAEARQKQRQLVESAMPSPFPGIDPYVENPEFWFEVHNRLILMCERTQTDRLERRLRGAIALLRELTGDRFT